MSYAQLGDWQPWDAGGRRKYVSADEAPQFLIEADQLAADKRALCYVLHITGCRVSEALELSIHRLDAAQGTLIFRTLKRRRLVFRIVPIPPFLVAMLLALPLDEHGRWFRMHRVSAWRIIKRSMTRARIHGPQSTCKGLRHGFGMRAAERAVPPPLMQRWMGHATLEMSFRYVDATGAEERRFAQRMWREFSSGNARSASSTRTSADRQAPRRSARRASCRSEA